MRELRGSVGQSLEAARAARRAFFLLQDEAKGGKDGKTAYEWAVAERQKLMAKHPAFSGRAWWEDPRFNKGPYKEKAQSLNPRRSRSRSKERSSSGTEDPVVSTASVGGQSKGSSDGVEDVQEVD